LGPGFPPAARPSQKPQSPLGTPSRESFMIKFFGSAIGIIFLIGLVVTIVLLKAIF
jgi:hypothetical protein